MMAKIDPHSSAESKSSVESQIDTSTGDGWHQLETFVDQLRESAHSPVDTNDFYRELLDGCVTLLAATGGVVWLPAAKGHWRSAHTINAEIGLAGETASDGQTLQELLRNVSRIDHAVTLQPGSRGDVGENSSEFVRTLIPVVDDSDRKSARAIVDLSLRLGTSPAVQQGYRELLETVAMVAAEFHVRDQLRSLQRERGLYDQSLELIRRIQRSSQLQPTAYEIANEGRRFVGADRLNVVVRQGTAWKVVAASGVERVEPRADVTKRLEALATATADWGELLEYSDTSSEKLHDLPPELTRLVGQHVDESQARRLVAVPVQTTEDDAEDRTPLPRRAIAVLIAEQFTTDETELSHQRVLELASLCEPSLKQALALDRFPMRSSLYWAKRWESVCTKLGLTKLSAVAIATALLLAALVLVRIDYEVAAPATLQPAVQRDIFASADGNIVDVKFAHGDEVTAGEVLAVLHYPQLLLDAQRVEGEIATTRKRLEAIAVTRTDRQVREETNNEKLPLSAEAEQLEKRLASLLTQQEILARRREALTLKSPIDGTVLTLDVQNLLRTRPVQRGQVLLTVADTEGSWRLVAEVPQDRIGQIAKVQQAGVEQLPVRFRLAGENDQTYTGHVSSISTNAVLDTDGLDQEVRAFEVQIDIDDEQQFLARPGMSAEVRIQCGRRSLGYVWLHDIWETVYRWLVF